MNYKVIYNYETSTEKTGPTFKSVQTAHTYLNNANYTQTGNNEYRRGKDGNTAIIVIK